MVHATLGIPVAAKRRSAGDARGQRAKLPGAEDGGLGEGSAGEARRQGPVPGPTLMQGSPRAGFVCAKASWERPTILRVSGSFGFSAAPDRVRSDSLPRGFVRIPDASWRGRPETQCAIGKSTPFPLILTTGNPAGIRGADRSSLPGQDVLQ